VFRRRRSQDKPKQQAGRAPKLQCGVATRRRREGSRSDATIASDPVAPSHFLNERIPNMTGSNDAIREIAKARRHHINAAALEKIVNELLDVPLGDAAAPLWRSASRTR